jgi:hypothetical protein
VHFERHYVGIVNHLSNLLRYSHILGLRGNAHETLSFKVAQGTTAMALTTILTTSACTESRRTRTRVQIALQLQRLEVGSEESTSTQNGLLSRLLVLDVMRKASPTDSLGVFGQRDHVLGVSGVAAACVAN